jgi:ferritin-like metal-binding protein YciE
MQDDNATDVIRRYLKDAIAAENSFETQLRSFAKEGDDERAHALFQQHAEETRTQIDRLTARLDELGDSPSTMKSFMAHMFGMAPKSASIGHEESERVTQNLIAAYTVENAEVAMYESLAVVAESLGDARTASLAREIQQEEASTARKVWAMIPSAAAESVTHVTAGVTRS